MRISLDGHTDLARWANGRARELVTARASDPNQFLTTTLDRVVDEVLQADDQALERFAYLVAALSLVGASAIWTTQAVAMARQPELTSEEARDGALDAVMGKLVQTIEEGGPAL